MSEPKTPFPSGGYSKMKVVSVKILLKSVIYAFAIFGILFILLLLVVLGLLRSDVSAVTIPDRALLMLDLDNSFAEVRKDNLLTEVSEGNSLSFADLLAALQVAGRDDAVKAIVAKVNVSGLGLAQAQELYRTIKLIRQNGKKTYIYSTGFGAYGGGTKEYYMATAFDKISMQPNAEVGLTGVSVEVPFVRGLLNKIGVTPEFFSRYEYKNAMASLTDKKISKTYKENLHRMVSYLSGELLAMVIKERGVEWKELETMMNEAPFSAEYAKEKGLIDEIVYESDWIAALEKEYDAEVLSLRDYAAVCYFNTAKPRIAVLVLEGTINQGLSADSSLQGEAVVGSQTVLKQIKEIEKDKDIKALVVRINSPGGSYTAANEIWYALNRLKKERSLPLVVSMGDYAASGGYFVALAGDKIFAEGATLTGSIGVLGGKMVFADLWNKVGVNWSSIGISDTANSVSPNFKFSKRQTSIFNKSLDRIYKDFTLKVSKARNIDLKQLDKLARGRIWLGREAAENGLIDKIGGLDDAVIEAKKLSEIEEDAKFGLVFYPKPKTLQEKLNEVLSSAPMFSSLVLVKQLGIDTEKLSILKRWQYDAVLPPIKFND